jgi:hypothetical protein
MALVRAGRPRVPLAGAFAWHGELAPHVSLREARASRWRHVRVGRVLVGDGNCSCEQTGCWRRGGDSSCGTETCRARRRLLVRGGDSSCGAETCRRSHPLAGDLSGKPPTGRRQGILPVMVLTRIHSPPYTKSCPSHCQWCQMTPSQR